MASKLKDRDDRPINLGDKVESKNQLTGRVVGCPGDGLPWPEDRKHDQVAVVWSGRAVTDPENVKASDLKVVAGRS